MIISSASKEELIALAQELLASETDEETSRLYKEFNAHFSHPDLANLFFWPESFDFRKNDGALSDYNPTPEEIVEIGVAHKAIQL
ncbi:MAG: colicin immunity protein [Pseudomonadota bacterium]